MSSAFVSRAPRRPRWRALGVTLALAVGIALLLTALRRSSFVDNLVYSTSIGLGCWASVDGGRRLIARLRRRPDDWPGWGAMLACVVVGVPLGATLGLAVADLLVGRRSPGLLDWASPGSQVTLLLAVLGTVVAVGLLAALERAARARAEAEAARRLAAETRLRLLESQLEPHMLFNTLANLRALIGIDPARAQAMLDRLIAFLRATLAASRSSVHPLHAEFARVDDYLALMAVRMGARLQARTDLPQELRDRPVPVLLLQPLVENAIRHGLEPKVEGGAIEVGAGVEAGRLVLTVRDGGVGLGAGAAGAAGGFGCEQVRERLRTLYGDAADLSLGPAAGGGTLARIRLPL